MSGHSKIGWTEATWNPLAGCRAVSPECLNCYAQYDAARLARNPSAKTRALYAGLTRPSRRGPIWTGKVRLAPERLDLPLRWQRRRRIFVSSVSDPFHADVPDDFVRQMFEVMANATSLWGHQFQVLTKRHRRMHELVSRLRYAHGVGAFEAPSGHRHVLLHRAYFVDDPRVRLGPRDPSARPDPWSVPPGIWLGVSAGTHPAAEERIPWLLQTPAAVRFVSVEPLLSPRPRLAELRDGSWCDREGADFYDALRGNAYWRDGTFGCTGPKLDWGIVGGESGARARDTHVADLLEFVWEAQAARWRLFLKQMGARLVLGPVDSDATWVEASRWAPAIDAARARGARSGDLRREGENLVWRGAHRAGADPLEWPEALRIQEYPEVA